MKAEKDWMQFESSGSINDYLQYRSRVEEEAMLARTEVQNTREQEPDGGITTSERLHFTDGNGAAGGSYR
ncbi:MAG TPA: hypothetical protein VJZ01_07505 [Lachnospiraceae bacterium]|jgi:hypothetical protein|nr:hypothetical protein [Lachnospiraceae bacterium]